MLGYLWAIWGSRRQAWHDKIASTVVVHAGVKYSPDEPFEFVIGGSTGGFVIALLLLILVPLLCVTLFVLVKPPIGGLLL